MAFEQFFSTFNTLRPTVAGMMSQGAAQQPATQPAAPATQPAAPAALTPQQEATQRFNRAYYAYLANPDMPLDPSESTGTLRGDQQALARARAARMLAAGQSAVAERAAAQGRTLQTAPDGTQFYGAPDPTRAIGNYRVRPSGLMEDQVQTLPTGELAYYDRTGRLVGTTARVESLSDRYDPKDVDSFGNPKRLPMDAIDRRAFNEGRGTASEREAFGSALIDTVRNQMSAQPRNAEEAARWEARGRAMQAMRRGTPMAGATAPAVAAAQGAPVAVQAAAPAPVPMQTTPAPSESSILPLTEEAIAETDVLERELARQEEAARQVPVETERRVRTEQFVAERARLLRQFEQAVRNGRPDVARRIQQQIQMLGLPAPTMRAPQAAPERPIRQDDFGSFEGILRSRPTSTRPQTTADAQAAKNAADAQAARLFEIGQSMARGVASQTTPATQAPSNSTVLAAQLAQTTQEAQAARTAAESETANLNALGRSMMRGANVATLDINPSDMVVRPELLQKNRVTQEELLAEVKRLEDLYSSYKRAGDLSEDPTRKQRAYEAANYVMSQRGVLVRKFPDMFY